MFQSREANSRINNRFNVKEHRYVCSNKEGLNVTIVEMVYLQIDENDLEMSQKCLRIIFEPE